ncbi:NAD(P)/FAD-dependent oxidoreductase [Metallumcola ferriviriculae]|uniref:NAD(P)/FAD-dependent oxidoreductase n=1 Tax=Metallumcola ferriviriculae TaxID=3039180 RepID=A0AAU0USU7_9FIRM|nr:NAD(P)/FAD-dependent oxidoreductase [Desulfitibacteraceae bacterium MK1]
MKQIEMAVIGAGPAGLGAAVEAAGHGVRVVVFDENNKPGGQLFKQIHKFFGSKEHLAGIRGFRIGAELLAQAAELDIDVKLGAVVYGLFSDRQIGIVHQGVKRLYQAEAILLATGAAENTLSFPGSTLPGVMSAGAAQTMANVHRVLPGKKVLMVGTGNVGLIVAYQLLQAGARVVALVDAAPRLGGYAVHAAKLRRAGVPLRLRHTIVEVRGKETVERAVVAEVDENFNPIKGSDEILSVDTVCLAVGLSPLTELAWMGGCRFKYLPGLGGHIPVHNQNMLTTSPGIYIAGDIAGVEEASTALEEGRLAGTAIAERLGYLSFEQAKVKKEAIRSRLDQLRTGPFGAKRKSLKETLVKEWI